MAYFWVPVYARTGGNEGQPISRVLWDGEVRENSALESRQTRTKPDKLGREDGMDPFLMAVVMLWLVYGVAVPTFFGDDWWRR